jgi:hypothetical protein
VFMKWKLGVGSMVELVGALQRWRSRPFSRGPRARSMWIEEPIVGRDAAHFFPQNLGLRNASSGSANFVSSFAPNRLLPATEELHR